MRVLIVQNEETESLGFYEQILSKEGIAFSCSTHNVLSPTPHFP